MPIGNEVIDVRCSIKLRGSGSGDRAVPVSDNVRVGFAPHCISLRSLNVRRRGAASAVAAPIGFISVGIAMFMAMMVRAVDAVITRSW